MLLGPDVVGPEAWLADNRETILEALKIVVPFVSVLAVVFWERRSALERDRIQRKEDNRRVWRQRRQDLIVRLQDRVYALSEGAGFAIVIGNSNQSVGNEDLWYREWNQARREALNLVDLLGDPEIKDKVQRFVVLQDEVANKKLRPLTFPSGHVLTVEEQLRTWINKLHDPLNEITSMLGARYQELEGPEPPL